MTKRTDDSFPSHPNRPYDYNRAQRVPEHQVTWEGLQQHETDEHMFVNGANVDDSRNVINLLRSGIYEPAVNLFKRGVDTASDIVETAAQSFTNSSMLDAARNVVNVFRSGIVEPSANLFKKGFDTAADVVETATQSFTNGSMLDGARNIINVLRGGNTEPTSNLFKRGVDTMADVLDAPGRYAAVQAGADNTASNRALGTNITDTRDVNGAPNAYDKGVTEEFKLRATVGAPGTTTYGALTTVKPWVDSSGGVATQTFKSDEGVWKRTAPAGSALATDWGPWQTVWDEQNNPTKVNRSGSTQEPVANLFKRGVDTASDIVETASQSFVAQSMLNAGRQVVNVFRGTTTEPVSNLFKRGVDTANDIVEAAGRWFTNNTMLDSARNVVNVFRNAITEPAANLFKRGTDTLDDVLDSAAFSRTTPNEKTGGARGWQGLNDSGRVTAGVEDSADIAGQNALMVSRSQHGVFLETFEQLPKWTPNIDHNSLSIATGQGSAGGNALRADNEEWWYFPANIPFDPSKLYRIRARVQQLSRTGIAIDFVGLAGVGADGITLVNTQGVNDIGGQHYICMSGVAVPVDGAYHEYTGWFKGWGAVGTDTGGHPADAPAVLHQDVRYIRPLFILNYSDGLGSVLLDEIAIDVFDEDGTTRTYKTIDSGNVIAPSGMDFSRAYTNKQLDNLPDGTAFKRTIASYIDTGNRVQLLRRNSTDESPANLFKRGVDTASDIVEAAGRWFTNNAMLDAGRNVINVFRNVTTEPVSNLFKRGVDTLDDVLDSSLWKRLNSGYADSSNRPTTLYRTDSGEDIGAAYLGGAVGTSMSNMLVNSGGQEGALGSQAEGWTYGAGVFLYSATSASKFGGRSLTHVFSGATDSSSTQSVSVIAGRVYCLEGWVKLSALPAGFETGGWNYGGWLQVANDVPLTQLDMSGDVMNNTRTDVVACGIAADGSARDWSHAMVIFRAEATGVVRAVVDSISGVAGQVWYDGILLAEVPPGVQRYYDALDENSRLKDQRHLNMITAGGRNSIQVDASGNPINVLSSQGFSSNSDITVQDHYLKMGWGTLHFGQSNLAPFLPSTTYYIYVDDPEFDGDTGIGYHATQNQADLFANSSRYFVGTIVTAPLNGSSSGGGGGGCFIGETPVCMADGTTKPIEYMRVGDMVLAMGEDEVLRPRMVTAVHSHGDVDELVDIFAGSRRTTTTPCHRFYVGKGAWKAARELERGDGVYMWDRTALHRKKVEAVHHRRERVPVYNITVEQDHTYLANGIVVHNIKLQ